MSDSTSNTITKIKAYKSSMSDSTSKTITKIKASRGHLVTAPAIKYLKSNQAQAVKTVALLAK